MDTGDTFSWIHDALQLWISRNEHQLVSTDCLFENSQDLFTAFLFASIFLFSMDLKYCLEWMIDFLFSLSNS